MDGRPKGITKSAFRSRHRNKGQNREGSGKDDKGDDRRGVVFGQFRPSSKLLFVRKRQAL